MTSSAVSVATDALLVASRALVAIAARSLADAEVTLPQFRALVVMSRPDPTVVGDIAAALDIHPSSATRLCDRLERQGLIRRRAGMSSDRRETTVALTANGRRLVGRITEHRRRDLERIASAMTAEARAQAVAGLSAFAEAAGELPVIDPFAWAADATARDSR